MAWAPLLPLPSRVISVEEEVSSEISRLESVLGALRLRLRLGPRDPVGEVELVGLGEVYHRVVLLDSPSAPLVAEVGPRGGLRVDEGLSRLAQESEGAAALLRSALSGD
ncbi:MAG: hypothetical protein DRO06_02090 [Thermoproteota archaeon]|nr:MAG: hypothetical protein DRO06_02090 [Candidatus Korarchaeota archaeon]